MNKIQRIVYGVIGAGVFYSLMFVFTPFLGAQPAQIPATPPATPSVLSGHATGGVTATVGSVEIKLNLNAHNGDPVKGNFKYSNSLGDEFKGDVDVCYVQSGNEAVFAGTVEKGNVDGEYFIVEVQDNGEGKKAIADRVRVQLTETEPDCAMSHVYPAQVTKGNLQVH